MTVREHRAASRRGITVHRARSLDARHVDGIPLTSPARTICDLAASESPPTLERALNEARVLRLVSESQLHAAIDRAPSRKGTRALRKLLAEPCTLTRSDAERRLLKLISDARLPHPQTNAKVHGYTVVFLWPAARLIVEFDGFAFHGHRGAFERFASATGRWSRMATGSSA